MCDAEAAVADPGTEIPVGSDAFVGEFLSQYTVKRVQPLIDRICEMPDHADEHQPAVQVANLLLRWCVASKCTHLLRVLPPRLTHFFAADVDRRIRDAFCRINHLEESFDRVAEELYCTPLSWGGMGMRPLVDVRAAAYVGAWMHCMAHVRRHHADCIPGFGEGFEDAPRYQFQADYRDAMALLDSQLGDGGAAYSVVGVSLADALAAERPRLQKALSRAAARARLESWTSTLAPGSRPLAILAAASSDGRRCLASEWAVTPPYCPSTTIPDSNYVVAVRCRLGIAVASGGRCQVRPRRGGGVCGKVLAGHADHCRSCAKAARLHHHNSICDLYAAIHRECGNRAWREVIVPEAKPTKNNQPIRSDVLVRGGAMDPKEYGEVKVRHPWSESGELRFAAASGTDAWLAAVEAEVSTKYAPARVRPWVFTTLGRPGALVCADLRRLSRQRLTRPDAVQAVSHASVRQLLLRRWRTMLSCAGVLGHTAALLDCLEGCAVPGAAVPPGPLRFYELQAARLTGF
jgi:hypothetical protein